MTFSINTNNAAMAALESLRTTQSSLNSTENAVSTGLKVSNASDNPSIYAISSTMNANISGLSAVSDSLSFGASVLTTASAASASVISTLTALQNTVTEAGTTGIDPTTMQTAIVNALNDINAYARQSTFNGVNLLSSNADAGSSVVSNSVQVVDSLNGNTLSVANQLSASSAQTLTTALGLTSNLNLAPSGTVTVASQDLLSSSGAAGGINLNFGSALANTSFSSGSTVTLQNGDGTSTTFEFTTGTAAATTPDSATNHTVTIVEGASESSNQLVGDLVKSMNANGYSAVLQSDGSVNVTGQGVKGTSTTTVNATGNTITTLTSAQSLVTTIQRAISTMTGIATSIGYASQQITGLQSFTSSLSDAMTSGVGALVDADLSEESAKLTSLQTKQQLAIQSLSIANSQSASILSLFR